MTKPQSRRDENSDKVSLWLRIGLALRVLGLFGGGLAVLALIAFALFDQNTAAILWSVFALIIFTAIGTFGFGILLAKVLIDRLENEEDDYYAKNVER